MPQNLAEAIEAIEAIMVLVDMDEETYLHLQDARLALLVREATEKEANLRKLL